MAPTSPPTIALRLSILASLSLMAITCSSAFHIPSPSIPLKHHASFTKSTPPLSTQPSYHHHAAAISRSNNMLSICKMMSSRDNNNNSAPTPSQEEIAQQKSAAYNALASFHETSISLTQSSQIQSLLKDLGSDTLSKEEEDEEAANKAEYWTCEKGAVTYNIPMDPAAGLKRGVSSKPYKCSVQVEMDLGEMGSRGSRTGKRGLRLVESIQFANGSNENDEDENDLSIPFVRSISLGANVDVDAVDGSYSLDDAIQSPSGEAASSSDGGGDESSPSLLPLLPPSLLLGAMDPTSIRFVVEHTLATSETERCRCFLLYGDAASGNGDGSSSSQVEDEEESAGDDEDDDDFAIAAAKKAKEISTSDGSETNYRLLGVILAEETKVMPKQDQTTEANESVDESVDDEDEDSDYAAEFISQMIETAPQSEDDQMSRLVQSLDKHNQRVLDSATSNAEGGTTSDDVANNETMERHSLGMFGLTSGVWLGDTFVRETSSPSSASMQASSSARQRPKGFGQKSVTTSDSNKKVTSRVASEAEDQFATWNQGVQKIALQFEWDYGESISQSYTYGKFMGTTTSTSSMANIKSDGTVVVNESSRRSRRLGGKEQEERRVVWDMDGGAYVAGLIGSRYFRAPRYMSFNRSRGYDADSYLTEFMVFYRSLAKDAESTSSGGGEGGIIDAEIVEGGSGGERLGMSGAEDVREYYCSRTSRLYDANDGSLMQGSTAFFSMKQALIDSMEP